MTEMQQELEALLSQEETNLTTYGKERIEELKRELNDSDQYD